MNKMHPKPTTPHGYILLTHDGKAIPVISKLAVAKEQQEIEVAEKFIEELNKIGIRLEKPKKLKENDQDVETSYKGTSRNTTHIEIQIAELPISELAEDVFDKQTNSYVEKSGNSKLFYKLINEGNAFGWTHGDKHNSILKNKIKAKVEKNYSQNKITELWLLIFATTVAYPTEYNENGINKVSQALLIARDYLNNTKHPFTEVWFYDLETMPTKVWCKGINL